jgi:hypothetical protein
MVINKMIRKKYATCICRHCPFELQKINTRHTLLQRQGFRSARVTSAKKAAPAAAHNTFSQPVSTS